MIRSNPTAIPLRASDVKHLQATVQQRNNQAAPEDTATGRSTGSGQGTETASQSAAPAISEAEQRRREKAEMTTGQRIGL